MPPARAPVRPAGAARVTSRGMIELPPGVKALGPEAEARVQELARDAQRRQAEELQRALEHTLRIVPKPLRNVVRKVLSP